MAEIEKKALALVNEGYESNLWANVSDASHAALIAALRRAIEQHEAFRREVSEAVEDTKFMVETHCDTEALALVSNRLNRFIIPKPDPLAECLDQMLRRRTLEPAQEVIADEATWLRAALAKRGLQMTEIER